MLLNMGSRSLPVGAEVLPGAGVHFRVWAPLRRTVEAITDAGAVSLKSEGNGYFSGLGTTAGDGTLYRYRLDGKDDFPDPASRYQPEGPHGPSQVVDPSQFQWTDAAWRGLPMEGQIIYELHIGTFTTAGTWNSATDLLPVLAKTGVTVIEMMPIADFSGQYGWGYDGVNLFAPTRLYGTPDDLRRFINQAHSLHMSVILDVVYNHLGPDGNYLAQFSRDYFTDRYKTDWGEAINFDGPNAGPVRDYFEANAGYWIEEFHFDGLRLDATQNIYDESPEHILARVTRRVREKANNRRTIVVAENEPQHVKLVHPENKGGYGMDGLWNDDYHHSANVALTGRKEAYYTDYLGKPQEFISAFKYGYLYQGQRYKWQNQRRGTPSLGIPSCAFVNFIQNHDQIANSGRGLRVHALSSPGLYRAVMAMTLLGPGTPMLFQGQEFASSAPFYYFADQKSNLRPLIAKGRREFLYQWQSMKTGQMDELFTEPCARQTFEACKLDHSEKNRHSASYILTCDLLKLRRTDPVISAATSFDGAVLSEHSFLLRYFGADGGDDRLMLVNLGIDLHLHPAPEPLLAPPEGQEWRTIFSTEDPRYGGCGTAPLETDENWYIPGWTTVVLGRTERPHEEKNG